MFSNVFIVTITDRNGNIGQLLLYFYPYSTYELHTHIRVVGYTCVKSWVSLCRQARPLTFFDDSGIKGLVTLVTPEKRMVETRSVESRAVQVTLIKISSWDNPIANTRSNILRACACVYYSYWCNLQFIKRLHIWYHLKKM